MEHLEKCPFCGADYASNIRYGLGQTNVECVRCHAKTSRYATTGEAITAWNRRPNPWQPVTATAPGHDIDVLIAYYSNEDKQHYTVKARRRIANTPTFDADDGQQYISPTLWAPCAQPPEMEEQHGI